jgi:hypothetical protein
MATSILWGVSDEQHRILLLFQVRYCGHLWAASIDIPMQPAAGSGFPAAVFDTC